MINLFKCHIHYILYKVFVYIFIVMIIFNTIIDISIAISLPTNLTYRDENIFYFTSLNQIIRLEVLVLSLLISSFSFTSNIDGYRALLIPSGVSRLKYFLTKYLVLLFVSLLSLFIIYLIAIIIGLFKISHLKIPYNVILNLVISTVYFSSIGILLVQITDSFYTVIIGFVLILLCNFELGDNLLKYFLLLIDDENNFYTSSTYYFFLDILLVVINLIIYEKRDLQT